MATWGLALIPGGGALHGRDNSKCKAEGLRTASFGRSTSRPSIPSLPSVSHWLRSPGGDLGAKKKKKKQKRKKEKPNSGGTKSDSASDSQEIKIHQPSKHDTMWQRMSAEAATGKSHVDLESDQSPVAILHSVTKVGNILTGYLKNTPCQRITTQPGGLLSRNATIPMQKLQDIQRAMELLSACQGPARNIDEAAKRRYQFWDTQPVPKLNEVITSHGAIEPDKDNVRQEPYSLPQGFTWDTLDLSNAEVLKELYTLLNENYVEDDDNMFRFDYSPEFLLWCVLLVPGSQGVAFGRLKPIPQKLCLSITNQVTKTLGLRPMEPRDTKAVQELINSYLKQFHLAPVMDEEEVAHWFLPREQIIDTFVVESASGKLTDFLSFYTLPSTVMHHPAHKSLKAAYSFYNIHTETPLLDLMNDALIIAKLKGFDVFNALDLMENKTFLEKLKFGIGDGNLQYYLYNWRCPGTDSEKVGLVLQ
ncbi:glycylpeptide N-tetradecanoyltransferase 2 [Ctenodactylus gundi]